MAPWLLIPGMGDSREPAPALKGELLDMVKVGVGGQRSKVERKENQRRTRKRKAALA